MSKRQSAESECDKCHAPILWARQAGGKIPLNAKPDRTGNFVLDELTMYCTKLDLPMIERAIERGSSLFSNHLVTCEARRGDK
jgi:hypothetical protein